MNSQCLIQPTNALFNHSIINQLQLQNLAIYPADFIVSSEDGIIDWANVSFQPIGIIGKRLWNFKGSSSVSNETNETFKIQFGIAIPDSIGFSNQANGTVELDEYVIDATNITSLYQSYSLKDNKDLLWITFNLSGYNVKTLNFNITIYDNDETQQQLQCNFSLCGNCRVGSAELIEPGVNLGSGQTFFVNETTPGSFDLYDNSCSLTTANNGDFIWTSDPTGEAFPIWGLQKGTNGVFNVWVSNSGSYFCSFFVTDNVFNCATTFGNPDIVICTESIPCVFLNP